MEKPVGGGKLKKLIALTVILIVILVIMIPTVIVSFAGRMGLMTPPALKPGGFTHEDIPIRVYLHEQNQITVMSLEEYLKGVVAAEMPAEFELEALKAQAISARTYAVKNMAAFGGSGLADHPGADVSTDYRQSQAWNSEAQLRARWGPFQFISYWAKISQAVDETRGIIITYQDEPIHAVFHSTSGATTASAQEVWGYDYPYLKAVPCQWDKDAPRCYDHKEFTFAELENYLGTDAGVVAASQNGNSAVAQILSLTPSGRVDSVRIGSKTFSGITAREKLQLRSANFTIEAVQDKLVFKTTGYGHGVGMSQYGANGMAKTGKNYRDILTYFYTGVNLKSIYGS